jgi:hypothetical protein
MELYPLMRFLTYSLAGDIFATTGGERVRNRVSADFGSVQNLMPINDSATSCSYPPWLCPQVLCIFLFMAAVSLFGTIIAEVNEIVRQITMKKKDLEKILESYQSVHPR